MGNKLITFLLIFSPLLLLSQKDEIQKDENSFILSIEDLKKLDEVVLFNLDKARNGLTIKSEGIVLLTVEGDWKIFKLLSKFESFGQIKNIEKFNKTICIFLEAATLILHSDSSIKKLDYILPSITLKDDKLYIINASGNLRNLPVRSFSGKKVYQNHLIEYDLNKKNLLEYPIKKFPGHITYVTGIEFIYDKIWISTYSRSGDFSHNLLYNISIQGEIYPDTIGTRLFPWRVFKIKKYKDELLIISSNELKKMNRINEIETDFSPEDFTYSADAKFKDNFMIWTTNDRQATYDYQAKTTKNFEKHIYNLENGEIINLPKSDLCCNTIKINDEFIYSYNYKKGIIEKRNIYNPKDVKEYQIKNKNDVEQSIKRQ